jgi:hypothetical protein
MRGPLCCGVLLLAALPCAAQETTFRADVDYVNWWLRRSYLPPVLTNGAGVVYGDDRLETRHGDSFMGGRFALEWDGPNIGVEGRAFFLERDSTYRTIKYSDSPLAFLYTDVKTGAQATRVIAGLDPMRGPLAGGFVGYSRIELFGEEVNAVIPMASGCGPWRVDLLAGARFLQMRDRYNDTATSRNTAPLYGFPAQAVLYGLIDNFRTHNAFYGGQVGVRAEADYGRWIVNGRLTAALGADDQLVQTWGQQLYQSPTARVVGPVGLFVQPSNSGSFRRCNFDAAGELALNVGYRLTDHVTLKVGYTFLLWADPLRATEQVQTVLNTHQGRGGPGLPVIPFKGEPFWAQGVNVGLDVRW